MGRISKALNIVSIFALGGIGLNLYFISKWGTPNLHLKTEKIVYEMVKHGEFYIASPVIWYAITIITIINVLSVIALFILKILVYFEPE